MRLEQLPLFGRFFMFLLFFFIGVTAVFGIEKEEIEEKEIAVAMRMIGHEVLLGLGDCDSRVLPIEKLDNQYRIPFEREFEFDPGEMVTIIDRVLADTRIAPKYLVEVEQFETKEIVHSFIEDNIANSSMIPCVGRHLPKDRYALLVTLLEGDEATDQALMASTNDPSQQNTGTKESSLFRTLLVILPILLFVGLMGYMNRRRNTDQSDPNLISIGASLFDQRNMALTFQDHKTELSNKEAALLSLLHTSANIPVERQVLLHRVWGDEGDYVGRTLDVFISKLRKKLEADASVRIVNIRGVGYKLVTDTP